MAKLYKMATQWMQRSEIDREIDRQMGIGPSSTRPSRLDGPTIGIDRPSLMDSSPDCNIIYFFNFKKLIEVTFY